MTLQELEITAEIWYKRLNNLKAWLVNNPTHWKRYKAADLAAQMAIRMVNISRQYIKYVNATSPKLDKYPSGGFNY